MGPTPGILETSIWFGAVAVGALSLTVWSLSAQVASLSRRWSLVEQALQRASAEKGE
jgi:hypothetical protein